jgi:hypothetical protein
MYNASSRASGLNAIGSTMAAANDANRDLLSADAGARIQNRDKLQEARRVYSDFEDKAFKINELDPYEFTMNKAQALQGAGMQNIMGGANTATQYAQQDANKKEDKEKFDYWMKMYETGKGSGTTPPINSGGSINPTGGGLGQIGDFDSMG